MRFILNIFNETRLYYLNRNLYIKKSIFTGNFIRCTTTKQKHNSMLNMSTVTMSDISCFNGKIDHYKGVTVRSDEEKCSIDEFPKKLLDSIKFWKESGNRGIWFKVHLDQSDWVPILAKNGFKYHHAKEDYVMMYLWLPQLENCNIPLYAHTMIGVGAVVVNEDDEILVVSEKYYQVPHYKLPGGYVEPGENLVDAAIREVWEETSIQTEFHSVLASRQTHNGMFGCSDIYTVMSLKPLSREIEKCDREIAECKWMKIDEYLNHPLVHELNRFVVKKYLQHKRDNIKIDWHHGIHKALKKPYTVYFVTKEGENNSGLSLEED